MAQQNINIGTADAKAGDTLFSAFTKTEANFTELYTDVGANTTDIATNTAAIAGISGGTKTYWFDDNDLATATTPISHTGGATNTYLTNDSLGPFTNAYNPNSKDRLWNSSTNTFDFTSLKIGDTLEFRGDIEVDTSSANQEIDILMSLAEGESFPYELNIIHLYYKSISSSNKITFMFRIYMGDEQTRVGGARFRFASDDNADIQVNGWFYQITEV